VIPGLPFARASRRDHSFQGTPRLVK